MSAPDRHYVAEQVEPLFQEATFEGGSVKKHFAQISKKSFEGGEAEPISPTGGSAKLSVFLGSRCTRVHFVRHAEGYHNVVTRAAGEAAAEAVKHESAAVKRAAENRPVHFATEGAEKYTDAELTEAGRNQCYALRGKMDRNVLVDPLHATHIDLVVVSPLRRCLETADLIFGPGRSEGRPDLKRFLVHDLCRERYGEFTCDKRRALSENQEDPRWQHWDWETQKEGWPEGVMPFTDEDTAWTNDREPEQHVHNRAMAFLQWLAERPEQEVAVVTHSSFLKNLFKLFGEDISKEDQDVLRAVPANCELRTVVLCHHG
eukprot:TRINITY_DN28674_c0_g1_i1.p1 TRINITY_DN28674_c0_g1~~TRINITY_DN28674_c0_g1_i1.p1  ORF type:complete len:368 (-),score=72.02 TRINITY_DN28674_c0_g1_i1:235-1185(-)